MRFRASGLGGLRRSRVLGSASWGFRVFAFFWGVPNEQRGWCGLAIGHRVQDLKVQGLSGFGLGFRVEGLSGFGLGLRV